MRKVISGLFITVDGVVGDPYKWQFDAFDEEMAEAMQGIIEGLDAALMGRVTYEQWAPYWPASTDEPFASFINNVPKYVVSTTLNEVELDKLGWQKSSLIRGDVVEAVRRMKQQPGKNIGVQGSPTLVEWLLQQDLLDELILAVHPVVAGEGKRLFKDGRPLKRLRLTDSKTTSKGVALLTYEAYP